MLVLSLFPGIGLLDEAFEREGFAVVRGPDQLWGGDVRAFHPPAGRFDGVIGGPPCQAFSALANFSYRWKVQPENLIPDFERVILEAVPSWFVMENVPAAPAPVVKGYTVRSFIVNNRDFGGVQDRERRISFGAANPHGWRIDGRIAQAIVSRKINGSEPHPTVTTAHGGGRPRSKGRVRAVTLEDALRLQGVDPGYFGPRSPFRKDAQKKMIVEGVPLPMGRAIATAVREVVKC